ncbi:UDP-N-acetylmuramate dehydrogenase [Candidatus Jorgensenbacteria bacterium]|nr:UDP-N-acetylmuramate dehydrogenase [Candidatus Jorgensenbacteria bacterium]
MVIKRNVNLAKFSTFKIGGRAEYFCIVKTPEDLLWVVLWALERGLMYRVFAGGSNIVFPDEGFRGLLVQYNGVNIQVLPRRRLLVHAGTPLRDVISKSISKKLSGLETLSGIPGTIGGAIVGNAGAYGHSIAEVVEKVEIWDGARCAWIAKNKCRFAYRDSILKYKPFLVLRAVLRFHRGNTKKLRGISRTIIKLRLKKYKPGLRCPGSFFKNVLVKNISKRSLRMIPKEKIIDGKIPAGYLLEQVGAKGMKVGRIKIADFHGNLFINQGGATAKDVKRLARILKLKVYKKFKIQLEEEIRYF